MIVIFDSGEKTKQKIIWEQAIVPLTVLRGPMIRYCCAGISAPVVDPISKIYGNWNHRIFGNAVNLTQYQKVTLFNLYLMLSTILRKHLKANHLISSLGLNIYWLHGLICWLLNKCITYVLDWVNSPEGLFNLYRTWHCKSVTKPLTRNRMFIMLRRAVHILLCSLAQHQGRPPGLHGWETAAGEDLA